MKQFACTLNEKSQSPKVIYVFTYIIVSKLWETGDKLVAVN